MFSFCAFLLCGLDIKFVVPIQTNYLYISCLFGLTIFCALLRTYLGGGAVITCQLQSSVLFPSRELLAIAVMDDSQSESPLGRLWSLVYSVCGGDLYIYYCIGRPRGVFASHFA